MPMRLCDSVSLSIEAKNRYALIWPSHPEITHNLHRAKVIIGPACTTACLPVSLMAKEYDVPVISYACSGTGE